MSWWSKLGKIGAGIAAPFTGGASLWAIPAIGAAEGGLRRDPRTGKRMGWKGAAIGGGMGLGEMYGGKALGALAGKIPGKPGDFISNMMTGGAKKAGAHAADWGMGPSMEQLGIPVEKFGKFGVADPTSSLIDQLMGGANGAASGSSKMSKVKSVLGSMFGGSDGKFGMNDISDIMGRVGDIMASGAKTSADNRRDDADYTLKGDQLGARIQDDYDRLGLSAQNSYDELGFGAHRAYDEAKFAEATNRREDESDAWKKLQYAEYINSGGRPYTPPSNIKGYEGALPSYGFGPKAPTSAEMAGASTLRDQMLARLQPGGSYKVQDKFQQSPMYKPTKYQQTPMSQFLQPGKGEKIQDWISRIAQIMGPIMGGMGKNKQPSIEDIIMFMQQNGGGEE
jgi:hypothetical protein